MKQYYLSTLLLLFSATAALKGQTVNANDDTFVTNASGGVLASVRANDFANGSAAGQQDCSVTNVSAVTTLPAGILISSCGVINVPAGLAPGIYQFDYELCLTASPNTCDTAHVAITVCNIAAPTLSLLPLDCGAMVRPVSVTNLPQSGTWTLFYRKSGDAWQQQQGNGTQTSVLLLPGGYTFYVADAGGCQSANANIQVFTENMFSASMIPQYVDTDNNGSINVGDIVLYNISVTNTTACPLYNIHGDGFSPAVGAGNISVLQPGATNSTGLTVYQTITQSDINVGVMGTGVTLSGTNSTGDYVTLSAVNEYNLNIASGFKLIAFLDINENGTKDAGEPEYHNGHFTFQVNNGPVHDAYSYGQNYIIRESNPASLYNFQYSVNNLPCSGGFSVMNIPYNNLSIANTTGITNIYFPIVTESCTDLRLTMGSNTPVPGNPYLNSILVRNTGTTVVSNATVTFTAPAGIGYASASVPVTPVSGGFTYNITNLGIGEAVQILITMNVPTIPAVNLGDILTSSAVVVTAGDSEPANDSFSTTREVLGAYDPNDKTEIHGTEIPYDTWTNTDYLTYTINFENTGTANANFIKITDQLSPMLNPATFRMLESSHNYIMERNGNKLVWNFNNVQLPPSQPGTMTGKGFVTFQIKPYESINVGTTINNTAAIFFDTNPAIVTNTVTTEFVTTLGTGEVEAGGMTVYPNPVSNVLHLQTSGLRIIDVTIADVAGKIVLYRNGAQTSIDMSSLVQGLYFVKMKLSNGNAKTMKVVKQ